MVLIVYILKKSVADYVVTIVDLPDGRNRVYGDMYM